MKVSNLVIGDRFQWCGRTVTLEDWKPVTRRHRRDGRWLIVAETDGTLHQLHYFDDEIVT